MEQKLLNYSDEIESRLRRPFFDELKRIFAHFFHKNSSQLHHGMTDGPKFYPIDNCRVYTERVEIHSKKLFSTFIWLFILVNSKSLQSIAAAKCLSLSINLRWDFTFLKSIIMFFPGSFIDSSFSKTYFSDSFESESSNFIWLKIGPSPQILRSMNKRFWLRELLSFS